MSWPALLVICGALIVIILVLFWHPQLSHTKTSRSTNRRRTNPVFRDDERYWYAGLFYTNPDDPALFVPKRFGLGWTLNFGHPQAKLVLIGILLLVILPPLLVALFGFFFPGSIHPSGCHPSGCSLT